ncbi:hypothetical protein [Acidocella sp.]|jgi:hypothetical protein|uniref:hypothetical protein n=1 Tax=Acidocella sp. TaxID=50710 RepID=UPI002F42B5E0
MDRAEFMAVGRTKVITALRGYESDLPFGHTEPEHKVVAAAHAILEHVWDVGHGADAEPIHLENAAVGTVRLPPGQEFGVGMGNTQYNLSPPKAEPSTGSDLIPLDQA